MFDLHGKTAIVTGGNKGLGLAMCLGLARAGADILNVSRSEDDNQICQMVKDSGRKYMHYIEDLSQLDAQKANFLIETAVREFGHVDILLNNAGANRRASFLEYAEEDWDYLCHLNLKSTYLLSQSFAKQVIQQKTKGKIINIASMLSFTGGVYCPAYTASKTGVMGLTKAMANELSKYNINCNAIAPGYMDTLLTKDIQNDPVRNKEILDRIPMKKWGQPESLQGVVIFLASDASDYVCGATIPVDGGWLSR